MKKMHRRFLISVIGIKILVTELRVKIVYSKLINIFSKSMHVISLIYIAIYLIYSCVIVFTVQIATQTNIMIDKKVKEIIMSMCLYRWTKIKLKKLYTYTQLQNSYYK